MIHNLYFLWTDYIFFVLLLISAYYIYNLKKKDSLAFEKFFSRKSQVVSLVIFSTFLGIAFLDSIHFQTDKELVSIIDFLLSNAKNNIELTYSEPFATELFNKTSVELNGEIAWIKPKLKYVTEINVISKLIECLAWSFFITIPFFFLTKNKTLLVSIFIMSMLLVSSFILSSYYHIFGTDKVGYDVFYISVKSIRTGILIGVITIAFMVPIAVPLGILSGYKKGIVDDIIQFIYTTLSSIPGVLLIAASVLIIQVMLENNVEFDSLDSRRDFRLLALCFILGVTGWTGLCRLIRAETMKIKELAFVQSSIVLGASEFRIMLCHILPNVRHLILITVVLDFSGLVLAEAVLSYVGVGVDPTTYSWGNMINSARLEMSREPIVWWSLIASFFMMLGLVLSLNVISDGVRDILDPKTSYA